MKSRRQAEGNISHARTVVFQIFILIVSNGEKILNSVNVVVQGQVKSENSSPPVTVRVSKTRVLKLPMMLENSPKKISMLIG